MPQPAQLDPRGLGRAILIVDLQVTLGTAAGKVGNSMDFFILKPMDLAKGNHKLFTEVNNRGDKLFGAFNLSAPPAIRARPPTLAV